MKKSKKNEVVDGDPVLEEIFRMLTMLIETGEQQISARMIENKVKANQLLDKFNIDYENFEELYSKWQKKNK